jgi:hypothetical protein
MSRLSLALVLALPLIAAAQPAVPDPDDGKRVSLAFDPGSHSRPISALGFSKDQTKLITVGWDYTVQVWNASTGERLDVLRLPPYGRDNREELNTWPYAAVSADGAVVAIGGGLKRFVGGGVNPTRLLVVDVANRRVRQVSVPAPPAVPVVSLALSADGDRLAVGFGGAEKSVYLVDDVLQRLKNSADAKPPSEPAPVVRKLANVPHTLALSAAGNKLAIEEQVETPTPVSVSTWDVSGKASAKWKKLGEFTDRVERNGLTDWSPDESQFARTWRRGEGKDNNGVQLRSADGKLIKNWAFGQLEPGFGRAAIVGSIRFLAADQLFLSARVPTGPVGSALAACVGVTLDPKTGKSARRYSEETNSLTRTIGTATADGTLAVSTTANSLDAVVYSLADGKVVARCGSPTPPPTVVGWANAGKGDVIAWANGGNKTPATAKPDDLEFAFDLTLLQPVARVNKPDLGLSLRSFKDWSLKWGRGAGGSHPSSAALLQGDKIAHKWEQSEALTLVPTARDIPLLARGEHDTRFSLGSTATISDTTGKVLAELGPRLTRVGDMVPSPDGRYLLLSTGNQRLSVYRGDGSSRFPLLNLVQSKGEWVLWTSEGYYTASPGGEKLIGWAVPNGPNALATFHPAERFATHYRRPDVLRLAVEKGSVKDALAALKATAPEVETILPPTASVVLVKQAGATVTVRAGASSPAKGKPVLALRVLLDGRPLPNGAGVWDPDGRTPAGGEFTFDVPPGLHDLKVLARNEDGAGLSAAVSVRGPKDASKQPTLYRVCVGVSEYAASSQNLGSAAKDARALYDALAKSCVGPDNLFGKAAGELLSNKDATRERVLKALAAVRKSAKPGDLLVLTFAGHGLKQSVRVPANGREPETTRDEFYLVTHDGDMNRPLAGVSLSGEDLRKELADIGCPVLLVLDACHAAAGVKAFRPATDDLTRSMTDDRVGVTVLSAAMSHETAGETAEQGHFTAALLKALAAGPDVPFDPHEKRVYVHHLYAVAFSEVRRATNGKQNPFLNMPWTMSPLAVREVPVR